MTERRDALSAQNDWIIARRENPSRHGTRSCGGWCRPTLLGGFRMSAGEIAHRELPMPVLKSTTE